MIIATPPFSILLDISDIMSSFKTTKMHNKRLAYVVDLRIGKESSLRQCQNIEPFNRVLDMHALKRCRISGICRNAVSPIKFNGDCFRKSCKSQLVPSPFGVVIKKLIKESLCIYRGIGSELKLDQIFTWRRISK